MQEKYIYFIFNFAVFSIDHITYQAVHENLYKTINIIVIYQIQHLNDYVSLLTYAYILPEQLYRQIYKIVSTFFVVLEIASYTVNNTSINLLI